MNSLLEDMEADVTTPSIGDDSLKEMSDLCAEQAAIEDEIKLWLFLVKRGKSLSAECFLTDL